MNHHQFHPMPSWNAFTFTSSEMLCHAVMIHWQRNGHTGLLDSSSWDHSMTSCQQPLTIQLLYVVLNGFFTTTLSTYSCEIIPPGMTTRSVFMDLPVIVTLISGVTCPLNTSDCYPLAPFHTTNNQSSHPTFRLTSDNRYSMQLLLRLFFVIQDHMWCELATICWHQQHYRYSGNFTFHCVLSHVAEKQQASAGTVKFFYVDITHSPVSYAHNTHTGL